MKKFIAFMIFGLLLIAGMQAQTSGTQYTIPTNGSYVQALNYSHTGDWDATTLKDSIGGATTLYWTFAINKTRLYYYQFLFEYDTVLTVGRAAGNHVTLNTYGSINGSYWTKLDSCLMHPTTAYLPAAQLTTASSHSQSLKDVTTGVLWRYLKFEAVGGDANTCSIISKLSLKIGERY